MREITGYEDKNGLPIVEGDILRNEENEICTVGQCNHGWMPFFFGKEWEQPRIQVIGIKYTAAGRRILDEWHQSYRTH